MPRSLSFSLSWSGILIPSVFGRVAATVGLASAPASPSPVPQAAAVSTRAAAHSVAVTGRFGRMSFVPLEVRGVEWSPHYAADALDDLARVSGS